MHASQSKFSKELKNGIEVNCMPGTINCSLAPRSQKVLEGGETIFLAKEPCFEPFWF